MDFYRDWQLRVAGQPGAGTRDGLSALCTLLDLHRPVAIHHGNGSAVAAVATMKDEG